MDYIKGKKRGQKTFLPDCIEDMIKEDNPVRVIDAFVDGLNLKELGIKRAKPNATGHPSYDPRDLLKLYVYGYINGIRSSRKLMKESHRNIELFYLINKLRPDFRTISDFRKDNKKAIKNVFKSFVKICMKLKLYESKLLAIDGTKIRAVNSKSKAYNKKTLNEKLARIDENIAKYLRQMDEEDSRKNEDKEYTSEEIKGFIEELKTRKEKYQDYLKELNETGETQKLTTDPEARVMHSKDGYKCAFNVQSAVDGGSHLIAGYEVTNACTDQGLLNQVSKETKETLEKDSIEITADKGYDSRKDILNCILSGTIPNVALKYDKKERIYNLEYEEAKISEEERKSTKSEDIEKCIKAGILPECFENTAVSIEVQKQSEKSCFMRNEDGTVTCPMGHILKKTKSKKHGDIYTNKDACRQCPNRCTSGKNHKEVSFGPDTKYVPVKMYGNYKHKLLKIPKDIIQRTPYNSFNRKDEIHKKVVLTIKHDKEKLKERMCLSEHPFGTVKWHHGAHYLLCKGKEKATAELGFSFLAYNIVRAINMVGTKRLIEVMRE